MAQGDDTQAAAKLAAAGQAGYDAYPRDCSHSVWVMLQQMGVAEPYRVANDIMAHLASRNSGWHQVSVEEAGRLANGGKVVIGGLANSGGSGHVLMVMPGASRSAGGFAGMRRQGSYPLSASGAASSWPGARSRGEKTVRDPWSNTDWPSVTFWTKDK